MEWEKSLTQQESQMLDIVREWSTKDTYRMVIEVRDGAWEIELSGNLKGKDHRVRGVGHTFAEAWDNTNPTWA